MTVPQLLTEMLNTLDDKDAEIERLRADLDRTGRIMDTRVAELVATIADLTAALREVVRVFDEPSMSNGGRLVEMWEVARAALARAREGK